MREVEKVERITHACVISKGGMFLLGKSHGECFEQAVNTGVELSSKPSHQGFFTSAGRFVSRDEAAEIAFKAKQTADQKFHLFSEDLWSKEEGGRFQYD